MIVYIQNPRSNFPISLLLFNFKKLLPDHMYRIRSFRGKFTILRLNVYDPGILKLYDHFAENIRTFTWKQTIKKTNSLAIMLRLKVNDHDFHDYDSKSVTRSLITKPRAVLVRISLWSYSLCPNSVQVILKNVAWLIRIPFRLVSPLI